MATELDTTTGNALLKEYYTDQMVQTMALEDNPFLATVRKKGNAGGSSIIVPVITDTDMNTSNTFANAQTNQSAVPMSRFSITRAKYFKLATISDELVQASEGDENALLDEMKVLVDSAILSCSNAMAIGAYRSQTGKIGAIGTIDTGVIQLTNPSDIAGFGKNQVLQASATDGGSPRSAAGYVIAINRALGQITVSATSGGSAGTPTDWTPDDVLLPQGNTNLSFAGLDSWFPATDPSVSDNFFSVNRSTDRTRLAGVYFDGSSMSPIDAIKRGASLASREGASPDTGYCTFETWNEVESELGAKVQYTDIKSVGGVATIGFTGIEITAGTKRVKLIPDRNALAETTFLLNMKSVTLYHLADHIPSIQRSGDGLMMLRSANAPSSEVRVAGYGQIACNAPGRNARIKTAV